MQRTAKFIENSLNVLNNDFLAAESKLIAITLAIRVDPFFFAKMDLSLSLSLSPSVISEKISLILTF